MDLGSSSINHSSATRIDWSRTGTRKPSLNQNGTLTFTFLRVSLHDYQGLFKNNTENPC